MTAPGIEIRNCVYSWRGTDIPLFSGEFSYWAVIRDNWRAVARSVKGMGVEGRGPLCDIEAWPHTYQAKEK